MVSVIAPIVGSVILGVGFLVLLAIGLLKAGSSTQQLRWVAALVFLAASSITYGAVAQNQGYGPQTGKTVLWALPALHVVTSVSLGFVVTLGLFQSLGARVLPPAISFLSFGALALGVFLLGFDMWYWYIVSVLLYALFILAILFVDRLEVLAGAVRGKKVDDAPTWVGLPWRLATAGILAFYYLLYALDVDVGAVITSRTVSLILWVVLDLVVAVYVFLVWWFVAPVEYNPSAPASTDLAGAFSGKQKDVQSSINGGARSRTNGYNVVHQ